MTYLDQFKNFYPNCVVEKDELTSRMKPKDLCRKSFDNKLEDCLGNCYACWNQSLLTNYDIFIAQSPDQMAKYLIDIAHNNYECCDICAFRCQIECCSANCKLGVLKYFNAAAPLKSSNFDF